MACMFHAENWALVRAYIEGWSKASKKQPKQHSGRLYRPRPRRRR